MRKRVLASLDRGHYAGSTVKVFWFPRIQSTHGDLGPTSTTFILSTAGPLPPVLRSRDVSGALSALFGRPWPPARTNEPSEPGG